MRILWVRWTQPALDDFKRISYRIEQERSLDSANRVCRGIYDAIQTLRRQPESGRPGANEGTRELVIAGTPYVAVYRVTGSAVEVLHIWHGAQNWR
jgi:toxin ParE1/3/4